MGTAAERSLRRTGRGPGLFMLFLSETFLMQKMKGLGLSDDRTATWSSPSREAVSLPPVSLVPLRARWQPGVRPET